MQLHLRQEKLETGTFLLFLILVTLSFFWLLKPFFAPIFWACAIAIIFYPVYLRLLVRTGGSRTISALLTLSLSILVVVLPAIFIINAAISQGVSLYEKVDEGEINLAHYLEKFQDSLPVIENLLARLNIDMDKVTEGAQSALVSSGRFVARHTITIGQNTFMFFIHLCIMLYLTFFMLRDGQSLIDLLIRALPMGDDRERMLLAKFSQVIRATIKGNLVIAVVQGGLGGLIFWMLGIEASLLWAILMAVSSLIPAIGPALIWVPVAIYLFISGQVASAVVLTILGVAVISLVDNLLRPILVGRETKIPDYIVLLSTLGGLVLFGAHGFVIGPLVAALFIAFWGIFSREINTEPQQEETEDSVIITENTDIPSLPEEQAPPPSS